MAIIPSGSWGDISFNYTATGGEEYMTVGNFKHDSSTTFVPAMSSLYTGGWLSVFVDKFLVEHHSFLILDSDTSICAGESTTLTASNSNTYAWAAATAPNSILSTGPTLTVSPTATTTYLVYGDSDTASITVTVKPTPTVNLGPDTAICQGDNLLLVAYQGGAHIAGTQYLWHNGNGTPFFTPTQSGTYWVSATLNGCTARDTVHVILNPSPTVDLGDQAILCEGQSLILNAFFPNATYLWQDNSILSTYTVTQTGTYGVTVRVGNCEAGDSVTVTEIPLPVVDLGNDTALCSNQTFVLTAAQPGASYLWQDHSGNATFTVNQGGLYWVEVNVAGCSSHDSLNVVGLPLPYVNLGNDTLPCIGSTLLLDATGPGLSYRWQDASQLATHTVTQSGTYSVQVTDANGCQNSDAVAVTFIQAPQFSFEDSTLCKGDVWVLDVTTPAGVYLWQDKSVLPTYSIHSEGTYWATVSNPCGSVSDTAEVQFRRCDCFLYVPNSFTPNDDYRNENFLLTHNTECSLEQYTFSIFNRWGQLIFETGNIEFLWDGTLNGKILPMDVYVYRVEYKFDKGPLSQQWGHVNIIR